MNLAGRATMTEDRSIAVTGETGSGKTTVLKMLAYQMPLSGGTAVIAHDLDTDYQDLFSDLGLQPIRLKKRGSDAVWNLFSDVRSEDEFADIAHAIIGSPPPGQDPIWSEAPKQILEALMTHLYREGQKEGTQPDHHDLRELVLGLNREKMHAELEEEFPHAATYISPDSPEQASSIYSELISSVKTVLTGDFGGHGDFSLRDYVTNPAGRVLIVDSDIDKTNSMGPIYSLILDMSIRYAMIEDDAEVNYVMDEIDALPPIPMLPDLASKGRGRDTRVLVGIQTLDQLPDDYGAAVMGNCPQEIHLAPGDAGTIEHIQDAVGERQTTEITHSQSSTHHSTTHSTSEQTKMRNPISSGALNDFVTGDAVVITESSWFLCHIANFEDIKGRLTCGVGNRYSNEEMMDFLDEKTSDDDDGPGPGGPGGDGGSSPPGAASSERGTEHRTEGSDGLLRRLFGFESDRGLTEAGRRNGYGDGGDRR